MLSTQELEKYILEQIGNKISEEFCEHIFFSDVGENCCEGMYIFAEENSYYIKYVEKWKVRKQIKTDKEREILWHVLQEITAHIIIVYALNNKAVGKDFRRMLFKKELDIFSLFGEDFEKRKKIEIEEVLRRHPYMD